MNKYYRVIKDNPLWELDAILKYEASNGSCGGYQPIEDIWNKTEDQTEYLSKDIVEDKKNSDFFERVYKSEGEKMVFKTADQLKKIYKKFVPDKKL